LNSNIPSHQQILENPGREAAAEKAYRLGKNGDLVKFGGSSDVIFPKLETVYNSKEFNNTGDAKTKEFLTDPGRAITEISFMVNLTCDLLITIAEWSCVSPPLNPKRRVTLRSRG